MSDRRLRTRNGCMTCKARKKKCDEVKPRCAACRRNQLDCEWPKWMFVNVHAGHNGPSERLQLAGEIHSRTMSIPPPVPILYAGSRRPCSLTPVSELLLGHYLAETAGLLVMTPASSNPCVTILLPLGQSDDLIMHGLLAVSGAHMAYREKDRLEVADAASFHYGLLVRQLRVEFSSLREDDCEKMDRLLRVLLILCQYEAISGDMHGNIFSHLRASHHLIASILECKAANRKSTAESSTLGFSLEGYAYLVSCNTFTPNGLAVSRTLPMDTFIAALPDLQTCSTFGTFFAGCQELYHMIPMVGQLSSRRLTEESRGRIEPSPILRDDFYRLHGRLTVWELPDVGGSSEGLSEDIKLRLYAGEALRQAIHIFLLTSLAGETVHDPGVLAAISQHVHVVFANTPHLIEARKYVAAILWPLLIAASCLRKPEWQERMLHGMTGGWFQMRQLESWAKVLDLLYKDPDPRSFGPYGLYLTMEKHGLNVANA